MKLINLNFDVLFYIGTFLEKKDKIFYYWVTQILWNKKYECLTNNDLVFLVDFFIFYNMFSGVKNLILKHRIIPNISALEISIHYARYRCVKLLLDNKIFVTIKTLETIIENNRYSQTFLNCDKRKKIHKMLSKYLLQLKNHA